PGSEAVRGSHQTSDQIRKADCCRYRSCHDRSCEERSFLYSAAPECESRGRDQDEGHSLGSSADQHISPLTPPVSRTSEAAPQDGATVCIDIPQLATRFASAGAANAPDS